MDSEKATGSQPPDSTRSQGLDLFDWAAEHGAGAEVAAAVQRRLVRKKRRRLAGAATLACALLLGYWASWVTGVKRYETPAFTQRTLTLPDGSVAEMGPLTKLTTDFRFGRRDVYLEDGDVCFDVVHDPDHPFHVRIEEGLVEVKGTVFAVKRRGDGEAAVTLFRGSIALTQSDASATTLEPGEQAALGAGGLTSRKLTPAQLEAALAWRHDQIVLEGMTLGKAAAEIARHNGKRVLVEREVSDIAMGGVFPLDGWAGFLKALPFIAPVESNTDREGLTRIHARNSSSPNTASKKE